MNPIRNSIPEATYQFGPARIVAVTNFLLFGILGLTWLYVGHPHEDAFIMFRYVENLAAGHGISYSPYFGAAEGATDFLWLLFLAALCSVGFDVAVAALVLNAIGAGIAGWIIVRAQRLLAGNDDPTLLTACSALAVPFSMAALAAYGGFSSMLYAALALLVWYQVAFPSARRLWLLPQLALLLGLYRPDGLILGALFVLLGLVPARASRVQKTYLLSCSLAALIGAVYFLWRLNYFGLLLPLPLYVKQYFSLEHGRTIYRILGEYAPFLKGIAPTLKLLLLCLPFAGFSIYYLRRIKPDLIQWWPLICGMPLLVHVLILLFSHQSQNIFLRFQAPDYLIAFAIWAGLSITAIKSAGARKARSRLIAIHVIVISATIFSGFYSATLTATTHYYVDVFPARLAPQLDSKDTIVLTEAGRMAFWTGTRAIDAVGLNTPETALSPITSDWLHDIRPTVIFFHPSPHADIHAIRYAQGSTAGPLTTDELGAMIAPLAEGIPASDRLAYSNSYYPVRAAALVLGEYLADSDDYEIVAAPFKDTVHVYGFLKERFSLSEVLAELNASYESGNFRSYASLRGFPGSGSN